MLPTAVVAELALLSGEQSKLCHYNIDFVYQLLVAILLRNLEVKSEREVRLGSFR